MAKTKKKSQPLEIKDHFLVPKHTKVSEKDKKDFMEKHKVTLIEIPRILSTDPAIFGLDVKEGDLIRIERQSPTAGKIFFYRCVKND